MRLNAGDAAPQFSLPDADLEMVSLSDYVGKQRVVLIFYPKDCTPCCTKQVTDFSDHDADFAKQNAVVLGINRDDSQKHQIFREKEGISLALLSDADAAVCTQYGVWQEKEIDEQKKYAIVRSTFIIDRQGIIRQALYNVNYKGHAAEVLKLLKELDT
ncbi:peroxiredoxin [Azonexus sp.]|uniref:peroxiredoxin n=1 Tax=Azonexus sp. TaxID=1872668 RepID=UPI0039E2C302